MSEGEGHTPSTSLISICEKSSSQQGILLPGCF
jgi:hypothetical protein